MSTVIIGGGQAGLALSYFLSKHGHEHVVLEQAAQIGNAWRNYRWDSFTFVTPNQMSELPGMKSPGDPDGYLGRDEIVAYFEQYARDFSVPVRFNVQVTAVEQTPTGYLVRSADGSTLEAANVVVATGLYQRPSFPACSTRLPADIVLLHSCEYRNPGQLPDGAVLVVGAGQSGCQIAEELYQSGRRVYLSASVMGRVPRRYRGYDAFYWADKIGMLDRTPDKLPSSKARFAGNPQVSGARGGHNLNLHQFARDGVTLLGHVQDVRDGKLILAPDLHESLTKTDMLEKQFLTAVDAYIANHQLDLPAEAVPELRDGYTQPQILELDLAEADIRSVIWATGFAFDYRLVKLPVTDDDGFPISQRGVTAYPGLYFLGMPYLHNQRSGLLGGVGEDAAFVAAHIVARAM
ncbi:MAG: NAD(P)-binding domain-containing protein [Anaerolineae bacterium]|nr:NAD(P)-binding domain-containing protein [Anaerolineae bacterium]